MRKRSGDVVLERVLDHDHQNGDKDQIHNDANGKPEVKAALTQPLPLSGMDEARHYQTPRSGDKSTRHRGVLVLPTLVTIRLWPKHAAETTTSCAFGM